MITFVGTEYVIGNAFIYLTEKRSITLKDLHNYSIQLQNYWNSNNIDAIITGQVHSTVYSFDNYFDFQKEVNIIVLKSNISKEMLQQRFVGYLPLNILLSFQKVTQLFS